MKFLTIILISFLSIVNTTVGNTITFVTYDDVPRKVIFYGGMNTDTARHHVRIPDLYLSGSPSSYELEFPYGWEGMFKAIREHEHETTNDVIQGEVKFQGWEGRTWFDVSGLHSLTNNDGIHYLGPKEFGDDWSGCVPRFPCDNMYLFWNDDLKTKNTFDEDLVCGIGHM